MHVGIHSRGVRVFSLIFLPFTLTFPLMPLVISLLAPLFFSALRSLASAPCPPSSPPLPPVLPPPVSCLFLLSSGSGSFSAACFLFSCASSFCFCISLCSFGVRCICRRWFLPLPLGFLRLRSSLLFLRLLLLFLCLGLCFLSLLLLPLSLRLFVLG